MCLPKQVEQLLIDFDLLAQPEVEYLLDGPGDLAKILEANHAAAALQGVEGAAQIGEQLRVVRLIGKKLEVFVNRLKHFVGFFEEDGQQLGVDFFNTRLRQLNRGRGGLRRFCGVRFQRGDCFINLWRILSIGCQCRERGLGLLAEFLVGHQISIFLQGGQILLEFFPQTGIAWLLFQCFEQGVCFALLLLDFLLDGFRRRFFFPAGFFARAGLHVADKTLEVDGAVLQ